MNTVKLNYDPNRDYKFGCVISTYNRPELVASTFRSINKSFIPDDLLFIVVDDASSIETDVELNHDRIYIKKHKNLGVANSLVMGWDILELLGIDYFINLDSDVEVSRNWLSALLNAFQSYEGKCVVTGFDGTNHMSKCENNFLRNKKSIGGINLFFHKSLYRSLRPALTSFDARFSSINEIVRSQNSYGTNPKVHPEYNGWDWGVCVFCETQLIRMLCTKPSVVQHVGYYGMNSKFFKKGRPLFERAKDFKDACVPKIIHQTWKDHRLPDHLKIMQESVIEHHQDYEYKFWSDQDIENFLRVNYPNIYWFYQKNFEYIIQKIDFIRLLLLYHFGGVYIDIDSFCLKSVDGVLGYPCSFVTTDKHPAFSDKHYPIVLNNAFIAAERNNDLIRRIMSGILEYQDPEDYTEFCSFKTSYTKVLKSAGPLCITDVYLRYGYKSLVNKLSSNYFFGVDYDKSMNLSDIASFSKSIGEKVQECHIVHMHESSWWKLNGKGIDPPLNLYFVGADSSFGSIAKSDLKTSLINDSEEDFLYLINKISDAKFFDEPFKHIYIDNFLSESHFSELTASISTPAARNTRELINYLFHSHYILAETSAHSFNMEKYVKDYEEGFPERGPTAVGFHGIAFKLLKRRLEKNNLLKSLVRFMNSSVFHYCLRNKFSIKESTDIKSSVQKHLSGYEVSPHPGSRTKALIYSLNVNPSSELEKMKVHTRLLSLKPEYEYVKRFWDKNPDYDTTFLPWSWCSTKKIINENNSLIIFSPSNETTHAEKLKYNHLLFQRTQIKGELLYKDSKKYLPTEYINIPRE